MKMKSKRRISRRRMGVTTLDYILVLGVILPLALFMMTVVPRMIRLVYETTVVQIGSPLM